VNIPPFSSSARSLEKKKQSIDQSKTKVRAYCMLLDMNGSGTVCRKSMYNSKIILNIYIYISTINLLVAEPFDDQGEPRLPQELKKKKKLYIPFKSLA
jgi:hypothetical protein